MRAQQQARAGPVRPTLARAGPANLASLERARPISAICQVSDSSSVRDGCWVEKKEEMGKKNKNVPPGRAHISLLSHWRRKKRVISLLSRGRREKAISLRPSEYFLLVGGRIVAERNRRRAWVGGSGRPLGRPRLPRRGGSRSLCLAAVSRRAPDQTRRDGRVTGQKQLEKRGG
jgi:hypothetical protein